MRGFTLSDNSGPVTSPRRAVRTQEAARPLASIRTPLVIEYASCVRFKTLVCQTRSCNLVSDRWLRCCTSLRLPPLAAFRPALRTDSNDFCITNELQWDAFFFFFFYFSMRSSASHTDVFISQIFIPTRTALRDSLTWDLLKRNMCEAEASADTSFPHLAAIPRLEIRPRRHRQHGKSADESL